MKRNVLVAVSLLSVLSACGPTEAPSADFSGKWYGTASIATPGGQPFTYNGSLELALGVGGVLNVSGICFNGTGAVNATADGRTAAWSGSATCPWFPGPACSTATVTLSGGNAEVTEEGTLVVTSQGVIAGCGISSAIGLVYYARK